MALYTSLGTCTILGTLPQCIVPSVHTLSEVAGEVAHKYSGSPNDVLYEDVGVAVHHDSEGLLSGLQDQVIDVVLGLLH